MGVYIKGMKMPTGCSAVTLKVWPDNQVEIFDADGEWKTSMAIPVPPHGRLIDVSDTVRVQMYDEEHEDWYTVEMTIDDLLGQGWIDAEAPTIIEAEE